MTSRVLPRCAVLVLGLGCRPPVPLAVPPQEAPPGTATLSTPAWSPTRYGVDQPRDVVVPAAVEVLRNGVLGTGWCADDQCVLSLVQPTERLEIRASGASTAEVVSLQPPKTSMLVQGKPVVLQLAPPGPDDPRGQLSDVRITLAEPADVTLDWRAPDGASPDRVPIIVGLRMVGPGGNESAHVLGQYPDEPGHFERTYTLPAGTHTARLTVDAHYREMVCMPMTFPGGFTPTIPDWCTLPDADGPPTVRLEWTKTEPPASPPLVERVEAADITLPDGVSTVQLVEEPGPASHTFEVETGNDVVVVWTPAEVAMAYRWALSDDRWARGACEDAACRFHEVPFRAVTMQLFPENTAQTVTLNVANLALPEPAFTLRPGQVADTWVERVVEDDPRGPFLDFLIDVETPGRYRVGVAWTKGEPRPRIELLGTAEGIQDTLLQTLGGGPYDLAVYDVESPGLFRVRVLTCPTCADQAIQVELQHEDDGP